MSRQTNFFALLGVTVTAVASAAPAEGQQTPVASDVMRSFEMTIEPQAMEDALLTVARITNQEILFSSDVVAGKTTARLSGRFTAEEATTRLLVGSGLTFRLARGAIIVVVASREPAEGTDDIVVTGSRIRGNASPSPVIAIGRDAILNAGQNDLGEAARSLPQSFSGGQNPGVGVGVSGASNVNLNGTSSLNLRGLGPDATLTLLNGHRLAYDGATQGIDISAIPVSAVARFEIVADGASALYGSDAVGGVANIILRDDFRGVEATARIAGATSGGADEQEARLLVGTTWMTGHVLAAYVYDQSTAILARQRNVADGIAPSTILVWPQHHHNGLIAVAQDLAPAVTLSIDGLYSYRAARGRNPYTATGSVLDYGSTNDTRTTSFSLAPRIGWTLGRWNAFGAAVFAEDNTQFDTIGYYSGAQIARFSGCQCNQLFSGEIGGEGPLFALPGGDARLAIGAGYRTIRLHSYQEGIYDVARRRGTSFAYGELSLPFVGPSNRAALVRALTLSLAARVEHYRGARAEFTPKVGIVYSPTTGVDFRGSWGRSFKAPTLYQQFSPSEVDIFRTGDLGYAGYPAGSTIAFAYGGREGLGPERAETWSVGATLAPTFATGLHASLNYFGIDFTNRVQTPIQSLFGALDNPLYADLITLDPSAAQLDAVVQSTSSGVVDQTGGAYDPASVVAIIDSRFVNVARERIRGFDATVDYALRAAGGDLTLSADLTHLSSDRRLTPRADALPLAGRLFSPPRWRVRGGASWNDGALTLSSFVNRIDGVEDARTVPSVPVDGTTTIDLAVKIAPIEGALRNWQLLLSAQNLFDDQPSRIRTSFAYATPYDSTNYSIVGRYLSLSLTRRW